MTAKRVSPSITISFTFWILLASPATTVCTVVESFQFYQPSPASSRTGATCTLTDAQPSISLVLDAARGFGAGGGGMGMGTASAGYSKKGNKKGKDANSKSSSGGSTSPSSLQKRLEAKYGGTTPQDIARGTQLLIDQQIAGLPPELRQALNQHRQLIEWDRRLSSMDLLALSNIPIQQVDQMNTMRDELNKILAETSAKYNISLKSRDDLQVLMQQITWNASADAKAIKSMTGRMPKDIEHRVIRASQYAAEAVQSSTISNSRILDVGCGYGVMTTFLQKAGIPPSQIHGIDLSTDMIRNAQNLHGQKGARFDVANFMDISIAPANENDSGSDGTCFGPYSCIVFCSSLHDLPDMKQALLKARDLLAVSSTSSATSNTPKGRLIIVHPQGASHVLQQQKANPVLVPRGLPTAQELKEWLCEDSKDLDNDDDGTPTVMDLKHSPADAKSQDEIRDGYIAVLDLR